MITTHRQKIAMTYYKAYSALCLSNQENISDSDAKELREIRAILFKKYKKHDPDNSFDIFRWKEQEDNKALNSERGVKP